MDLNLSGGPANAKQGGMELTAKTAPDAPSGRKPNRSNPAEQSSGQKGAEKTASSDGFALDLDLANTNEFFASKLERDILRDIENYDINKIPPSMEKAELHADCCKFGQPTQNLEMEKVRFCPCCCNIETMPFDTFVSTEDLDCFGPVIPLFFQFSKFLILLTFILSLFAAVGQYYIIKANCSPGVNPIYCQKNTLMVVIYSNRDLSGNFAYYQVASYMLAAITVLTFLCFGMFHKRAIKLKEKIDKGMITASDYTIMMYDIAPENESKEYIQNYIAMLLYANGAPPVEIQKINIGKFEGNLDRVDHEIEYVQGTIMSLRAHKLKNIKMLNWKLKEGIDTKILALEENLKDLKQKRAAYEKTIESDPDLSRNSVAFVTVKTQNQAAVLMDFDTNRRFITWLFSKFRACMKTKRVHLIHQAPEPDDVKWKFIGHSPFSRGISILNSVLVMSLAIGISLGIQVAIRIIQKKQINKLLVNSHLWTTNMIVQGIQLGSSMMVSVLNIVIVSISVKMSRYEKHLSHSMFNLSHTRKLVFLQFINTAGIALSLTYLPQELGGVESLTVYVFYMLLTNLLLGPLTHALDPEHLIRLVKQWWIRKQIESNSFTQMTQKEVNELFEPPDMAIYLRYCSVIRTFFVSCFFFDILPIGMPMCFLFLVVQFWTDKWMVLKRYKRSIRFHHQLSFSLNEFCEVSMFLLVLGNAIFKFKVTGSLNVMDIICVVVATVFIFYPTIEMAKKTIHNELVINEYHDNSLFTGTARNT
jgi:hypothetical protein